MFHAVAAAVLAFPLGGVGDYRVPPQPVPQASGVSAAAAARSYGGHTPESEPIAIRVRGRQVSEAVVEMRMPCDSGRIFPVATITMHDPGKSDAPPLKGGRLSKRGKFQATAVGAVDLGDQTAVVTIGLTGKLGAKHSNGRVAADAIVNDKATGAQVDHCTSQASWAEVVPERRVYSGSTEQSAPVVLELSKNRRSVQAFWYGLFADCTPDGSIAPVDVITNFKIRKGAFGDTFSDEGSDGAGGTIHIDFAFRGRLSRSSASGIINITATDRDAAGNTITTCPSGDVRWSGQQ